MSRAALYIASKVAHAPRWLALRAAGVPLISTWIDEAGVPPKPGLAALWSRCIEEVSKASAVIVYVEHGEVLRGVLTELGAALALGIPVYWVGPPDANTIAHHPGVLWKVSLDDAIAAARQARPASSPRAALARSIRELDDDDAARLARFVALGAPTDLHAKLGGQRDVEGPGRHALKPTTAAAWLDATALRLWRALGWGKP